MRKFLSLVLALAMAMSLVVVNTSAKEFTDSDDLNYKEAVDVISEIGVVDGYADGSFKPQNGLTRGAAAKIICNLILGPTTAAELHADTRPFKDVAIDSEFAGYIAYCAQQGIISGYADGEFKAGNPLTGYAFMKMLLGALGYDTEIEKFVGENWSINVAKQALGIGLNAGLVDEFNGVDYVTREEAALYAFNTLKATMVDYENKISANVNGAEVIISNNTAKPVTWSEGRNNDGNIKDDTFVQFAEEYFPDLIRKDDETKFMEPANTWLYEKTEIGTFERRDLIVETYTTGVSGRDLYDLLKPGVIDDNDLEVYVDGVDAKGTGTITGDYGTIVRFDKSDMTRSHTEDVGETGNGVLTKVYLDTDKDLITIVSINTYLAQAATDYSEDSEYATLTVYKDISASKKCVTQNYNVDVEEVENVVDVTKDSFYAVNVSWKDVNMGEIVVLGDVEVLEDSTISQYSSSDGNDATKDAKVTKLTTGGEEYSANEKAFYDDEILYKYNENLLTDATYNVYLDQYGYFLGVDLFEGTKNYVFITGFDRNSSNLSVKTATATGIFLDGTMENIEVNVTDTDKNIGKAIINGVDNVDHGKQFIEWSTAGYSYRDDGDPTTNSDWSNAGKYGVNGIYDLNQWYTYTVNDAGVYTLKPAVRMTVTGYDGGDANTDGDVVIRTDNLSVADELAPAIRGRVYGEDATVFLTVDLDVVDTTYTQQKAITDVNGVYTGVQNVDLLVNITDPEAIAEKQVYTVFDSDGYVIAAVVIGEAQGATGNYAYVLSQAKSERYEDGVYYWTFEAIMGGEKQTLTAKSSYENTIDHLYKGAVVELRFDGDYVVNVKDVPITDRYHIYTNNDITKFDVYYMSDRNLNADGTVNAIGNAADDPDRVVLQGNTLYITNRTDMGLGIAKDAKAVVIQKENGKEVVTNFSDVASAINRLADANKATTDVKEYDGVIMAVVNSSGAAEWVVFDSDTELVTGSQTGGMVTPGVSITIGASNVITVTTTDMTLNNPTEVLSEIAKYFENNGLIVGTPYQTGASTWTIPTFYDVGGYRIPAATYTYNSASGLTENVTYYINGVQQPAVAKTTPLSTALSSAGNWVDLGGATPVAISGLTTTYVESGRDYAVYTAVQKGSTTVYGVKGTSVAAQNPSFLTGNWVQVTGGTAVKVADLKFEAADQIVTDGLYEVDVDGAKTYVPTGTSVAVTADYALVNDEIAARGSIVVGTEDLKVEDGYYGRNFTANVAAFLNASVSKPVATSDGKIFIDKDGNIYGSDGETFQVTVNLGAGFLAKTTAKLTATDNQSSTNADMNLTGLTSTAAVTDSGNVVSFTTGSTNTGSIVVTFTLNAGATDYTLTAVNS